MKVGLVTVASRRIEALFLKMCPIYKHMLIENVTRLAVIRNHL